MLGMIHYYFMEFNKYYLISKVYVREEKTEINQNSIHIKPQTKKYNEMKLGQQVKLSV